MHTKSCINQFLQDFVGFYVECLGQIVSFFIYILYVVTFLDCCKFHNGAHGSLLLRLVCVVCLAVRLAGGTFFFAYFQLHRLEAVDRSGSTDYMKLFNHDIVKFRCHDCVPHLGDELPALQTGTVR